ncbi:hypothetical protein FA10DRAFT_89850 [Acaromyces ingoldii]|uniref:Uncharacterized protein n=1 Tax=Acaromyces ingoldii TaxID=215250 RepID=A0A316YRX2_9BASI|nr:hypothetical protein FA10DRAFT_89850 [Acaromyces ingoldii]PWN92310.1 hypothetical protein FA10DRAFT_89850 [Acaromyces ingoldii]
MLERAGLTCTSSFLERVAGEQSNARRSLKKIFLREIKNEGGVESYSPLIALLDNQPFQSPKISKAPSMEANIVIGDVS